MGMDKQAPEPFVSGSRKPMNAHMKQPRTAQKRTGSAAFGLQQVPSLHSQYPSTLA